jgi:hypothetical protein
MANDIVQSTEEDLSCAICFTDHAETPVTTQCGHSYCAECIEALCLKGHRGNACEIECCGSEGKCPRILSLEELESLLPAKTFRKILDSLVETYTTRNPGILRACPSLGCSGFYQTTQNAAIHTCPGCVQSVCTTCGSYLPPDTACTGCEMNNIAAQARLQEERQMPNWTPVSQRTCPTHNCAGVFLTETRKRTETCDQCSKSICTTCYNQLLTHPYCVACESNNPEELEQLKKIQNYQNCPKCGVLTEKMDGCDHIMCLCGAHFCWICSTLFANAAAVYEHLHEAHPSDYGYMRDVQRMEMDHALREREAAADAAADVERFAVRHRPVFPRAGAQPGRRLEMRRYLRVVGQHGRQRGGGRLPLIHPRERPGPLFNIEGAFGELFEQLQHDGLDREDDEGQIGFFDTAEAASEKARMDELD